METAGHTTITASRIAEGHTIRVERGQDGYLTATRRKRGAFEVTVTGKESVTVTGGRQIRYVINTDAGDTVPVTGAQTFTLVAAPGADLDDVPAPAAEPADQGHTWDFVNDGDAWRERDSYREMIIEGPAAPERSDMRPRTEMFRGRRLRVERGNEWGKINLLVNGEHVGSATGSRPEHMNSAVIQLRRDVVAADERRVTDPEAYPSHWFRGAEPLPAVLVAFARYAAEQEERDRAALRAATCTDPTHIPGTLGCPAPVTTCNGIPTGLDAVTNDPATSPINRGPVTGETGVMHIGRSLVREFGERHAVHGLALVGESDPYGRGGVRLFTVWALTVDGFPVTLVAYDGRESGLSPERRYAAMMVGADLVEGAGTLPMNQHPDEFARHVAWIFRNWLADQRDVHSDPRHTLPVVTITHTAADGTIIRGINGADGERIGLGSTDAHMLSKHLWHWSAGAGAWVLPLSAGRRPNVEKITNTRALIERDGRKVTVSMSDHDVIPTSGPETPAPGAPAPAPATEAADQVDTVPAAELKKGDAVAFTTRGVRLVGTVVRAKRDGLVTVDVPETGDFPEMWWDVRRSELSPAEAPAPAAELPAELPAPAVQDADQGDTGTADSVPAEAPVAGVDPVVRDLIARGWWDIDTVRTGRARDARKVTAHVFHLPKDSGRLDYDLFKKVSDQVQQIGGSRWNRDARGWLFAGSEITWNGTGAGGRTKSGQEHVAEWLAATAGQGDAVPAAELPAEAPAPAVEGADQVDAVPAAEVPAEAPAVAVPTLDGVPAGMPYVVDMPADWPTPARSLQAKDVARILRTEVLPAWFAGVKFSVRTDHGSMYSGVDISWTDGPGSLVVALVADQWQGIFYDGQHETNSYRGPILYVNAAGQATAYTLPGVSISTHRDVSDMAAMAAMVSFLRDVPDPIPHGSFVDPFGKTWNGGPRADCARWMASFGIDEWTRANRLDPRPKCRVERCALVDGHPWHVHRNDYGTPFLATLPDDGGNGGDGGQPTDDPTGPAPTGPTFSTWAELAEWIDGGRPAVVDQVATAPAPAPVPAGRLLVGTNDGRGNVRAHKPGCRDIKPDSAGGTWWEVTTRDVFGFVLDLYPDATPETWEQFADVQVMPCVGDLPDVADQVDTVPAAEPPAPAELALTAMLRPGDHDRIPESDAYELLDEVAVGDYVRHHTYGVCRVTHIYNAETICIDADGHMVDVTRAPAGKWMFVPAPAGDQGSDRAPAVPAPGDMVTVAGWSTRGFVLGVVDGRAVVDVSGEVSRVRLDRITGVEQLSRSEVAQTARIRMQEPLPDDVADTVRAMAEHRGPVRVADLVAGDRAYVIGIDQFGAITHASGYVLNPPSEVTVTGRTAGGRKSKDPKKARPGLVVVITENPYGFNGRRSTVVTLPDAYAERLTDDEHQFRPTLALKDADAVIGACTCGQYTVPAAPGTWLAARALWVSRHATPEQAPAPVVTAEMIAWAEQIGRDAYTEGHPVSAAPATHPEIMAMVEGWPVGAGAAEIFAAYTRGHAAAADRAAESALIAVNISRINTSDAEAIAARNPDAQGCADIAADGLASAWRGLVDRTTDAVTAGAAAGPAPSDADDREERIARTIAQRIAEKLSADPDMGEIVGRRGLPADQVADLVEQARTLPADEVRRLTTRLRAAYDNEKHARYGGKDLPYGPASIPTPVNGTPVHVWQHGDTRHTITAVSVLPHIMFDVKGTSGYETLRITCGAQIVGRSVAAGRDPAYRVFWRTDGGEWRSVTTDLTAQEYRTWNGWPGDQGELCSPSATVAEWLTQVMQATADDADWSAAAPEQPGPVFEATVTGDGHKRRTFKVKSWVTAHLDQVPDTGDEGDAAERSTTDQGDTEDPTDTAGEPPAGARPMRRPAVGAYVWHPRHGVCEVVAVHGRGGEDIGVTTPDGRRLDLSRHPVRELWQVVPAPATPTDTDEDTDTDDEPRSIYRMPLEAYTPQLDSDPDADVTIRHDHENGTVIEDSSPGDGVLEIAAKHGFEYRRTVGIFRRYSRDRFGDLPVIGKLAAELREAGKTVAVEVDDVWRPAAVREDAQALRASARAESLAKRATAQFAKANARRLAARRIADGMPFGEPVKVGHHSERAHRRAFARIETNDRASYAARDYAEELARRAATAEQTQASRNGGRAIMRRIEQLKSERRRWIRRLADTDKGTTGYARTCRLHIEQISEDIAFQTAKLGDMAASGAFVAWSAETIRREDLVNVGGWRRVARVNRRGVSVRGLYQWHTEDDITAVTWDQIFGRRRDGMQLDTPNGEAWPVADADKVERWDNLVSRYETCTSYDRTDEELRRRRHVAQTRRIVLGLGASASAQEVAAFGEPATVTERRAQAIASLDVYTRLEAGERFDQVAAAITPPVELAPAWRMPEGEPVDTLPRDLVPGDIVAGVWDGFATMRTVSTSIVGPVETVPRKEDRRESGDWFHVRINGEDKEIRSSRWLLVHRRAGRR